MEDVFMDMMKAVVAAGILIVVAGIGIFWVVQYSVPGEVPDEKSPVTRQEKTRGLTGEKDINTGEVPAVEKGEIKKESAVASETEIGKIEEQEKENVFSQEKVDEIVAEIQKDGFDPEKLTRMAMGGEEKVRAIMKIAADSPDKSPAAIQALENVRLRGLHTEIHDLFLRLAESPNRTIARQAVLSLGRLRRDAAVDHLKTIIQTNYKRGKMQLCNAAVQALGEMGNRSRPALDTLLQQLGRASERTWIIDFGSRIIEALQDYDSRWGLRAAQKKEPNKKTEPGLTGPHRVRIRKALLVYADELEKRLKGVPNRASRKYLTDKIKEARDAAVLKTSKGSDPEQGPSSDPEGKTTDK